MSEIPDEDDFERAWEREWQLWLVKQATRRTRGLVKPKQFQIFHLHVLKEQPVDVVARRLRVTRAQVYVAKFRVGKVFAHQVEALKQMEAKTLLKKGPQSVPSRSEFMAPRSAITSAGKSVDNKSGSDPGRSAPNLQAEPPGSR